MGFLVVCLAVCVCWESHGLESACNKTPWNTCSTQQTKELYFNKTIRRDVMWFDMCLQFPFPWFWWEEFGFRFSFDQFEFETDQTEYIQITSNFIVITHSKLTSLWFSIQRMWSPFRMTTFSPTLVRVQLFSNAFLFSFPNWNWPTGITQFSLQNEIVFIYCMSNAVILVPLYRQISLITILKPKIKQIGSNEINQPHHDLQPRNGVI